MQQKRPVFLNLLKIALPINALVSILHRVSGVVLFLLMPLTLLALQWSTSSPAHFDEMQLYMDSVSMKLLLWVLLSAFVYHLIAGVRHILMDSGLFKTLRAGQASAWVSFVLSVVIILGLGYRVWLF